MSISIHAPRTGSDKNCISPLDILPDFNPRSPHGERRRFSPSAIVRGSYFNPRSPHGERRRCDERPEAHPDISFHAPRTGSDDANVFLILHEPISIHAPRTGSDGNP